MNDECESPATDSFGRRCKRGTSLVSASAGDDSIRNSRPQQTPSSLCAKSTPTTSESRNTSDSPFEDNTSRKGTMRSRSNEEALRHRMLFSGTGGRAFSLGVCVMECKAESNSMKSILKRLRMSGDFDVVVFKEESILNDDILDWPKVDCLISFYSTGFPLEKAIEYVQKFRPITLNDLENQITLRLRTLVNEKLKKWDIPIPRQVVVDHAAVQRGAVEFEENLDSITYEGFRIGKPFIEKPVDADDHNNNVYYPRNAGGGCKKLFRKVHDRSSEFFPDINQVRRDKPYVYEEFLPTFGTDVKVYTVGQMFAHAEARKAPTLDGRVMRTQHGKEVRYPVLLSEIEKRIAYRIVEAFQQTVCGFDILRTTQGRSVVCDVNGWSFVKGNVKYYNDCAHICRVLFLSKLQERHNFIPRELPAEWFVLDNTEEESSRLAFEETLESAVCDQHGNDEELRTVVVLMRHGDRKPKQKLKFESTHPLMLSYFASSMHSEEERGRAHSQVKLKSPEDLAELASRNLVIIKEMEAERYLRGPGFLRIDDDEDDGGMTDSGATSGGGASGCHSVWGTRRRRHLCALDCHRDLQHVLEQGDGFTGINRKIQIKPAQWDRDGTGRVSRVLVTAKWGGELTNVGQRQAERLGKHLRASLYPGDSAGFLRLHSTFRHDFKIYTSDEGRCQVTSAAFTKGFLDLEGDLTPILVQMVVRDRKSHHLLDEGTPLEIRNRCKAVLDDLLNSDLDVSKNHWIIDGLLDGDDKSRQQVAEALRAAHSVEREKRRLRDIEAAVSSSDDQILPPPSQFSSILKSTDDWNGFRKILLGLKNPKKKMFEVHTAIEQYISCLQREVDRWRSASSSPEAEKELAVVKEIKTRWILLQENWFKRRTFRFDSSKVPEVVDNIRYDLTHHLSSLGESLDSAHRILRVVQPLGNLTAPAEYGLSLEEKVAIALRTVRRLLKKILRDLTFYADEQKPSEAPSPTDQRAEGAIGSLSIDDESDEEVDTSHVRLKEEEARQMGIKFPWRIVRSRYYVASASHVQCLLNILLYGHECLRRSNRLPEGAQSPILQDDTTFLLDESSDVHYLSHIIFRVWERKSRAPLDCDAFRVSVEFSTGAGDDDGEVGPTRTLVKALPMALMEPLLAQLLHEYGNNRGLRV